MSGKTRPPDPGGSYANASREVFSYNGLSAVKLRWFRLPRKFSPHDFRLEGYPSLKSAVVVSFRVGEKKAVYALQLGLDREHANVDNDLIATLSIKTKSGLIFRAVLEDEVNASGALIDLRPKYVTFTDLPQTSNLASVLRTELQENCEFYSEIRPEYGFSGTGKFNGKIRIQVKSFKKLPPRSLDLRFDDNVVITSEVTSYGFKKDVPKDLGKRPCFTCGKPGHQAVDCTNVVKKVYKWKCEYCGNDDMHCYTDNVYDGEVSHCRIRMLEVEMGQWNGRLSSKTDQESLKKRVNEVKQICRMIKDDDGELNDNNRLKRALWAMLYRSLRDQRVYDVRKKFYDYWDEYSKICRSDDEPDRKKLKKVLGENVRYCYTLCYDDAREDILSKSVNDLDNSFLVELKERDDFNKEADTSLNEEK